MSALFGFLLLVSLIGLVAALVRPHTFKKLLKQNSNRKHLGLGFGCLILLFLILGAVTTPKTTTLQTTSTKATLAAPQTPKPTITAKTTTITQPVPFTTSTEQDSSLAKGTTKVKVQGVNGVETQTYKLTYTNGKQTGSTLVSTTITSQLVNEVIEDGTYVAPPPAAPAPGQSCYPLTNGGNCYEPGEYCRNSDQGASGVAGDGKVITCEDNDGWRWEPK